MIHRFPRIRFVTFLMMAAIPFAVVTAEPVGRQTGGGSTMDWQLNSTGHEKATLTWSCADGEVSSLEFKNGKAVSLHTRDLGTDVQDGVCSWELRLSPKVSKDVAKKLEAARNANDDKAARKIMKDAGFNPDAMVMSGAFTIQNGAFVDTEGTEGGNAAGSRPTNLSTNARPSAPIATDDQVIPDDLIVQGSGCFGFDCVNNESFGFDTIRMKENNTRVKFEDTSVGTFPTNDWQLTANDSASGGASKFSIEDITGAKVPMTITAGASTNSIFVDSTGRVGFRTSTPVLDLHVATSNTPAIRLEQNNAGGFTAQTWDIAGNEANFFVRDVTSGSRLPLRIRPGAPTSSIDISADGDVGIGTASPQLAMHIFSTETTDANLGFGPNPGSGGAGLNIGYSGAGIGRGASFLNSRADAGSVAPNPSLRFWTNDVQRVIIDNEGFIGLGDIAGGGLNPTSPIHFQSGVNTARLTAAGVWQDASSRKAKEHITDLDASAAIQALRDLKPVTYNYKNVPEDPKVGFIAEDVPEIVATPERDGLSALDIVAVVTKVVQEQQKTIEQLNERIAQLEAERQQ
ncbi:MAG TPA: tail fiber domain-containing protein [Thermoanaerobaculia bacterium]